MKNNMHYILLFMVGFFTLQASENLDVTIEPVQESLNIEESDMKKVKEDDVVDQCHKETEACLQSIEVSYKHLEDGMDIMRQVEACQESLNDLTQAIIDAESIEEIEELRKQVDEVRITMDELQRKAKRWSE
jgi:DNA-binding FrmR family transcriptional regulator